MAATSFLARTRLALTTATVLVSSCTCTEFFRVDFTNYGQGPLSSPANIGTNGSIVRPADASAATAEVLVDSTGRSLVYKCIEGDGTPSQRALDFVYTGSFSGDILYVHWNGTARNFGPDTRLKIRVLGPASQALVGYDLRGGSGGNIRVFDADLGSASPTPVPLMMDGRDVSSQRASHFPAFGYRYNDRTETNGAFGRFVGKLSAASATRGEVRLRVYFEGTCGEEEYEMDDVVFSECCPNSAGDMCEVGQG